MPAITDASASGIASTTSEAQVAAQGDVPASSATEVGDAKASPTKVPLAPRPKVKHKAKRHRAKTKAQRAQGQSAPPEFIDVCHATGSATNPYVLITVNTQGLQGHGDHPNDIIPAPAGGCPGVAPPPSGKIAICHATGSATNPFVLIEVSQNGLEGHGGHPDDIIPAPATGCPGTPPPPPPPPPPAVTPPTTTPAVTTTTPTPTSTPAPTEEAPSPPTEEPRAGVAPAKKTQAPAAAPAAAKVSGELPFTGMSSGLVAGLGVLLLLLGFSLRRATNRRVEPGAVAAMSGTADRVIPVPAGLRVPRRRRWRL